MEQYLLSQKDINSLLIVKDYRDIIRFLRSKNWAVAISTDDIDEIIRLERENTIKTIKNLVAAKDNDINVILYQIDFYNLKKAIRAVITEGSQESSFMPMGSVNPKLLFKCIEDQDFAKLPKFMEASAKEAFEILLKTNDANLCDSLVDKTMLDEVMKLSKTTGCEFIKGYAELFVAFSDIKIALRGCKLKKTRRFFDIALAECQSLNIDILRKLACVDIELLREYLLTTEYSDLFDDAGFPEDSLYLDKWFDDKVMALCSKQKSNPFTIAPIISYALARELEFKNIKIVCIGKKLGASEPEINERLRKMYV